MSELMVRLGVAALCGLAVGVEREWSAKDDTPRFAGVRTFLLLGLLGGLSAAVQPGGAGLLLLGGALALVVASYATRASRGDPESTTEVAALVVLGAGFLAGGGALAVASGLAATTVLVLAEKGRVHSAVHAIRSHELEAGARFAVLALVVLPLLPAGPFGPEPGIRPRELWALVLLFSGLSFAGFVAVRLAGPERGYGLAGLLGGLVSSTAVTLSFSRESKVQPELERALAVGTVAACTVLNLRVLVLATVLRPELAGHALRYLALPTVVGALYCGLLYRRRASGEVKLPGNPLRLRAAILMTAGLGLSVYAIHWVRALYGQGGVQLTAALLGLVDMDALIYSMSRGGVAGTALEGARALAIGVAANGVLKATLALALGSPGFRKVAGLGLAALLAATAASLGFF